MNNQELEEKIRKSLNEGYSVGEIKTALREEGFRQKEINRMIKDVRQQNNQSFQQTQESENQQQDKFTDNKTQIPTEEESQFPQNSQASQNNSQEQNNGFGGQNNNQETDNQNQGFGANDSEGFQSAADQSQGFNGNNESGFNSGQNQQNNGFGDSNDSQDNNFGSNNSAGFSGNDSQPPQKGQNQPQTQDQSGSKFQGDDYTMAMLLAFVLPPFAYYYLGNMKMALICFFTLNYLGTGWLVVPYHVYKHFN